MTGKQKKMLIRICVSAAMLVLLHFLPEDFPRLRISRVLRRHGKAACCSVFPGCCCT